MAGGGADAAAAMCLLRRMMEDNEMKEEMMACIVSFEGPLACSAVDCSSVCQPLQKSAAP